ncbi:hypothetical protein [Escherichia coli]|uniref:hypothetical protein n=1 Tax=Escherichia coli TaxID=562 RepID=UPI00388D5F6A
MWPWICRRVTHQYHSIPVGLYKISQKAPEKGDYVISARLKKVIFSGTEARLHRQRLCPEGVWRDDEADLAAKGDEVAFRDDGVYVNGQLLPYSKP